MSMSMSSCANSRKDGGGLMLSSQIMPHFIAKDEATGAPCSEVDVDMRDLREMWDIGPCIGPRLVIISCFHKLLYNSSHQVTMAKPGDNPRDSPVKSPVMTFRLRKFSSHQ